MRIALTALITAACLYAAESATSFVTPGGEFVATGNPAVLRPIVGIRGSRVMGSPVNRVQSAIAAPGGSFAIVDDAGELSLIRAAGSDPLYLRRTADRIAFSSTGATAAFLDTASARVEVWTGLPSAPRILETLSAVAPAGVLSSVEISDDGQTCLGVSESGDVYELSSGNAPRRSALARQVSKVRFVPGTRDLLLIDANGQLSSASLSSGDIRPLPGLGDSTFTDVVLSNDGGSALAVSAGSLVLVSLNGKEPQSVPWARGVSRISSLRGGQFAITVGGEAGAWILNPDVTLSYVAEF